jgi:hypothetical protein
MKKLLIILLEYKEYEWDWEENHISYLNYIINIRVDIFLKKIKRLSSKVNALNEEDREDSSDNSPDKENSRDYTSNNNNDCNTLDIIDANFG